MKIKYLFTLLLGILLAAVLALSAGCTAEVIDTPVETGIETPSFEYEDVTAQEAYSLIEENRDNPDFVIIDVRTPAEYGDGHVEGAVNIDYNSQDFPDKIDELDKGRTYLIYCRSGNRSGGALAIMKEQGFPKVYHMDGGMLEWMAEKLPLVK